MLYHHCFFNVASDAISKVRLILNGTNQLLAYDDDVNVLGNITN
jgi:hypothetical protein